MRCRPGACADNGARGPTHIHARAYAANTRPTRVRDLMAERSSRTGSAADFLRVDADRSRDGASSAGTGWPKSPRALAGRLRRAPTFLRLLGIDIAFGREGRAGSRVIRMHARFATTVSTVSSVRDNGHHPGPRCDQRVTSTTTAPKTPVTGGRC